MRYGYLGPAGTFTEQAARYFADGGELVAYVSILEMLVSADRGEVDFCVAPIENTTEGDVNQTLDSLIFDTGLYIKAQVSFPVVQNLMIKAENKNKPVAKILSHPQGLAQSRKFLSENYNGVPVEATSSTAEAARIVSQSDENFAAVGISLCAEIYKLEVICRNIQDSSSNKTRFVLLSKTENTSPKKGKKTSLAFSVKNKPGELYKILDIFSLWDINLSKITSRPNKEKNGEYVFYVDIDGFEDEKDAADALKMVRRKSSFFKNLGTYDSTDIR